MPAAKTQTISLVLHVSAILLLLILSSPTLTEPHSPSVPMHAHLILLAPTTLPAHVEAKPGRGSNSSGAPPRRGVAPPVSYRTFVPPEAYPNPKLPITPTIDFDAPVIAVSGVYGDPLGNLANGLYGNRGGHGIGDAPVDGGIGPGPGGAGLDSHIGSPIQPAQVIYRVDPEFSEDARKARFQGMVVLMIEIGLDGRAHNPKVIQPAGLGLDEKAIEAVGQWRFRPAHRGATPLVTTARVEVHFHLM